MKRLSTKELLNIWETYMHYSVMERSLYLLSAIYETDVNTIARMSIGERDARLLKFREWLFGSRLINMAYCPNCSALVEWETNTGDISIQAELSETSTRMFKMETDGFKINFRLPNSLDIMQTIADPTHIADTANLISGCILSITKDKKAHAADQLSQEIIEMINQRMSEEDAQADIKMVLSCPECKKQWEAPFEIMRYLWLEIDNWANHLLQEVAILARAFSWSEQEILNLSFNRRRMYLEMIS